ncbi:hypothetical protein BDR04DRAFT_1090432 [Suillus decipiens]|nr:hypothetical protein BDR04DRAFT_1090432 [Suillus decipiens]
MFSTHLTVLALLTFLAGANAGCTPCAATLTRIDGMTYKLAHSSVGIENSYVECDYRDKLGNEVICQYDSNTGLLERDNDNEGCPGFNIHFDEC